MNVIISPNLKRIRTQLNRDGSETILQDDTKVSPVERTEEDIKREIEALQALLKK